MASQWFCKLAGKETGPLTFQELVELARAGTLNEADPVRRTETDHWIAAREVVGLFRAAQKAPAEAGHAEPSSEPKPPLGVGKPAQAPPKSSAPKGLRTHRRGLILAAAAALALVAAGIYGWKSRTQARFPPPQHGRPVGSAGSIPPELMRAPPPKEPSIPGLEQGVPVLVPGLEEIGFASYPSMSADLCVIAFSAATPGAKTAADLYLAARDDVSRPFGKPQPIESCNGPKMDVSPALSPDGLELVFVRANVPSHFFYAKRPTRRDEFGEPVPWPEKGLQGPNQRVGHPRFPDPLHLFFNTAEIGTKKQSFWIAQRGSPGSPFGDPKPLDCPGAGARAFLSQDGLRSYFGGVNGLFLGVRAAAGEPFNRVPLVDASVTGPISETVWVAPKEDVVLFSSPGPGKEMEPDEKLWLIRY